MDREPISPTWMHALNRQQERRRQGIPTLTVLAGDAAGRATVWQAWLRQQGRAGVTVASADAPGLDERAAGVVLAWMRERQALSARVLAHLVEQAPAAFAPGVDPAALWTELARASQAEREQFLAGAERAGADPASIALLDQALMPGAAHHGNTLRNSLLSRACTIIPEAELPGLLLIADPGIEAVARAAAAAVDLACSSILLPVALAMDAWPVRAYLDGAPESRVKAAVRTGLVELAPDRARTATAHVAHETPDLAATRARLHELGDTAELLAAFADAAKALDRTRARQPDSQAAPDADAAHAGEIIEDGARSAVERLLFLALEATPETAGLFALNQRLDFHFGPALIEVDLACTRLNLAVEVDGYYHFRDADAYRRDRRKDLLLQLNHYLVVRCLADDVLAALDRVLDTIRDAVAAQRARSHPRSTP